MNIVLQLLARHLRVATVANIPSAKPEQNVLGNIGGMIGNAFQVPGGEYQMENRVHAMGILGHICEQALEDPVAVGVDDIIALEDFGSEVHIAEDEGAETLADH